MMPHPNSPAAPPDLAMFTGRPRFAAALHVGRPNIGNRETFLTRVNDMLDRRWLSIDRVLDS